MTAQPLQDATLGLERTGIGEETYRTVYSAFQGWFSIKPVTIKTGGKLASQAPAGRFHGLT